TLSVSGSFLFSSSLSSSSSSSTSSSPLHAHDHFLTDDDVSPKIPLSLHIDSPQSSRSFSPSVTESISVSSNHCHFNGCFELSDSDSHFYRVGQCCANIQSLTKEIIAYTEK